MPASKTSTSAATQPTTRRVEAVRELRHDDDNEERKAERRINQPQLWPVQVS